MGESVTKNEWELHVPASTKERTQQDMAICAIYSSMKPSTKNSKGYNLRTTQSRSSYSQHVLWLALFLLAVVDISKALMSSPPFGHRQSSSSNDFLVPSQALKSRSKTSPTSLKTHAKINRRTIRNSLVPSQVLFSHPDSTPATDTSDPGTQPSLAGMPAPQANDEPPAQPAKSNPNQKRNRRRNKANASDDSLRPARYGNLPDVEWRAIAMEHLRQHPNFEPLPLPETVKRLDSLEDIRWFRQESWQWDAVHGGRCTTSQAVAALGFLEPKAGKLLGVPRSWHRGGMGAYHRLRQPALRTLQELNTVLCAGHDEIQSQPETNQNQTSVWTQPKKPTGQKKPYPFAAKYMIKVSEEEKEERRQRTRQYSKSPRFDSSVRMMWGNAQEATSLLTALNFFWNKDDRVILKEVGMCGGGLDTNTTTGTSNLLVGATPDGLLYHPDGTIEVVEVKNHCPFYSYSAPARKGKSTHNKNPKRFSIRHYGFDKDGGILPHYVPQLMMEMLCVGPTCLSAIMVRQTATTGALVMRIQRDNGWIEEMLYWLNRFQADFVELELPPPENFFFNGSSTLDQERYLKFLNWTKDLESKVELLAHVLPPEIQRATGTRPGTTNLFLD